MSEKMRTISFLDEFIKEDGCFKAFADFVRSNNELELLFRGNSSDVAIVYFCNNVVWKFSKSRNIAKVTVNYNHLRYTENWPEIISEKLHKIYGFPLVTEDDITSKYDLGSYHDATIDVSKGETFDNEYVSDLYDVLKSIMADYFFPYYNNENSLIDDSRLKDHFRDKKGSLQRLKKNGEPVKKPNYLEKQNQQAYFTKMCQLYNGIYIYDLEYKETHSSINEKKAAMLLKGRQKMNKPDCLGIRFVNGKPISLVMVEMKSKAAAEHGDSGTEEHLEGMWDDLTDCVFLKVRIREAKAIFESYRDVRMHGFIGNEIIPSFDAIEEGEIVIVYTDELANSKLVGNYVAYSDKYPNGIPYAVDLFQK